MDGKKEAASDSPGIREPAVLLTHSEEVFVRLLFLGVGFWVGPQCRGVR